MAAIQTFHRGLRKLIVAPWSAENSYGTAHAVKGAQNMGVTIVYETDEARGDDAVLDRHSKPISVTVTMQEATVDLSLWSILTGGTLISSADYYDVMHAEDDETPYVALAGRIVGSGGVGDLHIFIPKAKISASPQFNATQDAYVFPSYEFQGVMEGTINGLYRFRNFTAPTALAIPLRTATGGF